MLAWFIFFKIYFITRVSDFVYCSQLFWGFTWILELLKARLCFHSNIFRSKFLIMNFRNIRHVFDLHLDKFDMSVCQCHICMSAYIFQLVAFYSLKTYFRWNKYWTVYFLLNHSTIIHKIFEASSSFRVK